MLMETGAVAALIASVPAAKEALRQPVTVRREAAVAGFASGLGGVTRYDWHGPADGPVTICIHGLTTPSFVWRPLLPLLTMMGHRVLTYDLPGRGLSDRGRGAQTAAFFCDHLSGLLATLKIAGPIRLIGYSMGGAIATSFAARNRDRIRDLVLLAPAGMGHRLGPLADMAARVPGLGDWAFHMGYPRQLVRDIRSNDPPATIPDLPERLMAELHRRGYLGAVLSSMRGILAQPQDQAHRAIANAGIPVTAFWGDQDSVIPLHCKDKLRAWNPSARHAVIYGADHGLPFTHPESIFASLPSGAL